MSITVAGPSGPLTFAKGRVPSCATDSAHVAGPSGPLTFAKGDRVGLDDPCGIGGMTLFGTVARMYVDDDHELCALGVDVEPSVLDAELRSLLNDESWGSGRDRFIVFAGDYVARAARGGKLRLAPREPSTKETP